MDGALYQDATIMRCGLNHTATCCWKHECMEWWCPSTLAGEAIELSEITYLQAPWPAVETTSE